MKLVPYRHRVHYYETDTMKVVHHSNYIRWMEEARCDMLEQMGIGYDGMEKEGVMSPVLRVECEYKSMTRYADTVEISARLESYTGVRFEISYEIRDAASGELRAKGRSSHCFIDGRGPISLRRNFPAWDAVFRAALDTGAEN